MRAVVQRVKEASVRVEERIVGKVGYGLLILLGVGDNDQESDARYIADKIAGLRIFADDEGKMNRSVTDIGGEVLVISQFTLFGDVRRGRRPSFVDAAAPQSAIPLYEAVVANLKEHGLTVATGEFQAIMDVALVNAGPVTILLDSKKRF